MLLPFYEYLLSGTSIFIKFVVLIWTSTRKRNKFYEKSPNIYFLFRHRQEQLLNSMIFHLKRVNLTLKFSNLSLFSPHTSITRKKKRTPPTAVIYHSLSVKNIQIARGQSDKSQTNKKRNIANNSARIPFAQRRTISKSIITSVSL
jgi:hypothetical protein